MPTLPRRWMWPGMMPILHASGVITPGQLGPISRLPDCIEETKADLAGIDVPATILGHVGDGNFHVIFSLDPDAPDEFAAVAALNERLVRRAIDMDGTCTGEHGIGLGKQPWLVEELGEDAIELMRMTKRALDPTGLFNPGKIFAA